MRDPIVVATEALAEGVLCQFDIPHDRFDYAARQVVSSLRVEGYKLPPQPIKPARGVPDEERPESLDRLGRWVKRRFTGSRAG